MTALIIVDAQNDFCPGGALAVPHGDEIIGSLNELIEYAVQKNWHIFASRDWHPKDSEHFKKWPVHCVQNSHGAEFHPGLRLPDKYGKFHVVSKGMGGPPDGYSVFSARPSIEDRVLLVCGLATEYCVLETVKDAVSLGHNVILIADACRALDKEAGKKAIQEMQDLGVLVETSVAILSWEDIK